MVDVAIIIVSYNTKKLTSHCLASVIEKTRGLSYRICLVDNASIDGSADFVETTYPDVCVIRNDRNLGFAVANNIAIKQVDAKYIFLLNSDTVLLNNAVKIFYDFMENGGNENIACCGGNLFCADMKPQLPFGNFPSLRQVFFEQFYLNKIFPAAYARIPKLGVQEIVSEVKEVAYVSGADLFVRKSVVDAIGPLDEKFFLYYEDTDFGCRVKKAGLKSVIVPDARIVHLVGQSSAPSLEKMRIEKASEFLFFRKHYGRAQAVALKVVYAFGCVLRLLLKRDAMQVQKLKIVWHS